MTRAAAPRAGVGASRVLSAATAVAIAAAAGRAAGRRDLSSAVERLAVMSKRKRAFGHRCCT